MVVTAFIVRAARRCLDSRPGSLRHRILAAGLIAAKRRLRPRAALRAAALLVMLVGATPAAQEYAGRRGQWVRAVASAYSPHDDLDADYHAQKGADRWLTAHGVDVRRQPYGVAAPLPHGTRLLIPAGNGYLDETRAADRVFTVDDSGGLVRQRTFASGVLHIDLRYRTERSALRFGVRPLWVFVIED